MLALDAATLVAPKADLVGAAMVIAGAIPGIEEHRAELVALVGREKVRPLDRLELVVRTALQAHARHRAELGAKALEPLAARARRQERNPSKRWFGLANLSLRPHRSPGSMLGVSALAVNGPRVGMGGGVLGVLRGLLGRLAEHTSPSTVAPSHDGAPRDQGPNSRVVCGGALAGAMGIARCARR